MTEMPFDALEMAGFCTDCLMIQCLLFSLLMLSFVWCGVTRDSFRLEGRALNYPASALIVLFFSFLISV